MKSQAIFDLETNGLLDEVTTIHCLVFYDVGKKQLHSFPPDSVYDGLLMLSEYDQVIGHNIIGYDIPVVNKLHPDIKLSDDVIDTLLLSKLAYYNIHSIDEQSDILPRLKGRHSLESWGYRLNDNKGDFGKQEDAWDMYTNDMLLYCEQDVKLTVKLLKTLQSKEWLPDEALRIEQEFARVITEQTNHGWLLDIDKAQQLHIELMTEKDKAERELHKVFKPKYFYKAHKTYKKVPYKRNNIAHWEHSSVELTSFNPGSRQHIANGLVIYMVGNLS